MSLFKEVFLDSQRPGPADKIDQTSHDLIHIDIFHDYANTYEAGRWAVEHSNVVLFHDTESFPAVKAAVFSLADQTGMKFYNYGVAHGLGILVRG